MRVAAPRAGLSLAILTLLTVGASTGCGGGAPAGRAEQDVIYGSDDRTDYYAETDPRWKDLAYRSVVAMINADFLVTSNPQNIQVDFETVGQYSSLCSTERFINQVAAADCSGTLIDDDLVLTAGHCVETNADCTGARFVFRYLMTSATTLETITSEDVFRCQQVLVRTIDDFGVDHGIVRLDRAATPRHQPAPVSRTLTPVQPGDSLVSISCPDGIPIKIDANVRVLDSGAPGYDFFNATLDVYAGSSGSGVFNQSGVLVGIEVRGEDDYTRNGSCYVSNVLAADGSQGYEEVSYAANAIKALCDQGYPSSRLCGDGDGGTSVSDGGTGSPDGGTGGVDGGTGPRTGGGCSSTGSGSAGAGWTLVLLLLLAWRVRRARPEGR